MSDAIITAWCEKCRRLFPLRLVVDTGYIPPKSRMLCEGCAELVEGANAAREKKRDSCGGPIYCAPFEGNDGD
jgi:hypothetical protein